MPDLTRTLRRVRDTLETSTSPGRLGRHDGVLRADGGLYWVRPIFGGAERPAIRGRLKAGLALPIQYDIPVRLSYPPKGLPIISGPDEKGYAAISLPQSLNNPLDPQSLRVYKEQMMPLRCRPSQDPLKPLWAEVLPDKFVIDGTYYDWPGDDIDLSGAVPSSGNHQYTIVFWRPATNDLSIASSTPQGTGTALDDTDVQEAIDAADAGAMPIKAFVLTGDQTALNGDADHTLDIRTLFNASGGGGGTGDHHTLTNLTTYDDHTQYPFMSGRAGGQIVYGGTADTDNLEMYATAHGTPTSASIILRDVAAFFSRVANSVYAFFPGAGTSIGNVVFRIFNTGSGVNFGVYEQTAGFEQSAANKGDLLKGANAGGFFDVLAIGTNGYFAKVVSGTIAWAALQASDIASGVLALARGGTGSDLSGTGPGVLVQATLGAVLTVAAKLGLALGGTNADLSATGGTHQFLKQSSSGAAITVGQPAKADISDLETITTTPTASAVPKADGSNKLAAGWISEVLGLTDLSDVALSGVATDDILVKGASTWGNVAVAASRIIGKTASSATKALTASELWGIVAAALDTSIVPTVDNADDLGSTSNFFRNIFSYINSFKETSAPSTPGSGIVNVYVDTAHNIHIQTKDGQDNIAHAGDVVNYLSIVSASTTPTNAYLRTIKGGSLGSNGSIHERIALIVSNTGATGVNCTFDVVLGSSTLFSVGSTSTGAGTPRYVMVIFDITIANQGSASAQLASAMYFDGGNATDSTTMATLNKTFGGQKKASENTATDLDLKIVATLGTATNSKAERQRGEMVGPNNA